MSDAQAMCAVHPEAPSVVTCHRCGRFCCERCMAPGQPCNECVARALSELPPLEPRANYARYALFVMAAAHTAQAGLEAVQLAASGPTVELIEVMSGLLLLAYIPLYIATIVLVCRWFHLAARHALARQAPLDVTPGGAVGAWFIPFLNLARPFTLTRQMLATSGADQSVVGPWQAAWIAGNMVSNVSVRADGVASVVAGLLGDLLLVGAAVLGARAVATLKF